MINARTICCVANVRHKRNIWVERTRDHAGAMQTNFFLHSAHRNHAHIQFWSLLCDQTQTLGGCECSNAIIKPRATIKPSPINML